MTDIVLTPITSGYNLTKINSNFVKVQDNINNDIIHNVGGNNVMHQDLDLNFNSLLNARTDPNNPESMLTVAEGDERYYNVSGDLLEGPMDVGGQVINNLPVPTLPAQPVRKDMLDSEIVARAGGDASLQEQLNGVNPPMGSAFSVISWHDQAVTNSINIPANKNAWSFGPVVTVVPGQIVTIGTNSFWTIANGAVA